MLQKKREEEERKKPAGYPRVRVLLKELLKSGSIHPGPPLRLFVFDRHDGVVVPYSVCAVETQNNEIKRRALSMPLSTMIRFALGK